MESNKKGREPVPNGNGTACLLRNCLYAADGGIHKTAKEVKSLKSVLVAVMSITAAFILGAGFMLLYPFKTVEFLGNPPIEITNPDKMVPLGGVVNMKIKFHKHTNAPGLTVRTLIRKKSEGLEGMRRDLMPLDSSTVVSTRKAGEGETNAVFVLGNNPENVGPNTHIVFSIYYTLFGFVPRMVQYESEAFTIYDPNKGKVK